jgi:hypothetical protein
MTFSPLDVVLCLVVGGLFTYHLVRGKFRRYWKLLACLTPLQWVTGFLGAAVVLAVIVTLGALLFQVAPAWLNWSWLMLFGAKQGGNVVTAPFRIPYVAWVFWVMFFLLVPKMAYNEERDFRRGAQTPGKIAAQSLRFGLAHWIVGVPLTFCLALALGGVWFAYQYKRGGVRRSTAYHAMHNWLILLVVGIVLATAGTI